MKKKFFKLSKNNKRYIKSLRKLGLSDDEIIENLKKNHKK